MSTRKKPELFFGLVGALGTDFEGFGNALEAKLQAYGYEALGIRLSDVLDVYIPMDRPPECEIERIESGMRRGDELRENAQSGDALACAAAGWVHAERADRSARPYATAYVFRSLKHPGEVQLFRDVYGDSFFLIGLHSTIEERTNHLMKLGANKAKASELISRDEEDEATKLGQRARDVFELADYFVRVPAASPTSASGDSPPEMRSPNQEVEGAVDRLLMLLFGHPAITPFLHEHAMYLAYTTALRSGQLSRQVGATLVSPRGDVLGLGANDVPRPGGGLYWHDDEAHRDRRDGRDHNFRGGVDSNPAEVQALAKEISRALARESRGDEERRIERVLRTTDLFSITEYGRAVHAEMEAILSCARVGTSTRDATLFATTFPCHNCARHIVAAGIRKVVFIEPYPKSRALDLHNDSIELAENEPPEFEPGPDVRWDFLERVQFVPYLGVGPRRYLDLFSMSLGSGPRLKRRDQDKIRLHPWDPATADPRVPTRLDAEKLEEGSAGPPARSPGQEPGSLTLC